jgi:hypothetical protein
MQYVQLFEDFVKNYGQTISHKEFESLKPGQMVLYMGAQYEVVKNNKVTIVIKSPKRGDTLSINYSMFNHGGAITENKVSGNVYKSKDGVEYYVEKESGHYVVVSKSKGGVPTEAWDDWFNRQEDAEEIASKLASGELDESLFMTIYESKPAMMYYVVAKDVIKDRRLKVYPENIERLLNNLQADGHLSYDAKITPDAKKDIENALDKLGLKGNELLSYARKGLKYESEDVNEADDDDKQSTDRSPIDNDAVEKGLKNKSEESGVPIGILRAVMRRGMAAWKSGHRPGAGQEQWGYARVNSFLTKGKGTWGKADKDLAKEVRDGGHDSKL